MSHVLVVVARQYNGHELWTALGIMQERGHSFDVVSTATTIQDEVTKVKNRILLTLDDVPPSDVTDTYDALMIVSGNMKDTEAYWHHPTVLEYVAQFNSFIAEGKNETVSLPIAAICCSVPTIRNAARNKEVSFFPLIRSRELLANAGAILKTTALTRFENLVTAEHQMATQMWAEEFCNLMEGKPPEHILHDSGFTPKGFERMPIPEVERWRIAQGLEPTIIRKVEPSYDPTLSPPSGGRDLGVAAEATTGGTSAD